MSEFISLALELFSSIILFVIVINYVLTSKALYGIAKKFKMRRCGFAWIPIASDCIMGSIADSLEEEDIPDKPGKILYSLSIMAACVLLFLIVVIFLVITKALHVLFIKEVTVVFSIFIYFMLLIFTVLLLVRFVFATICAYKIFVYAKPEKANKYLVFSIIIPVARAICLNKCKNNICKAGDFDEDITVSED